MIVPVVISRLDDDQASSVLVACKVIAKPNNKRWSFTWDEDSLSFHLKDSLRKNMETISGIT